MKKFFLLMMSCLTLCGCSPTANQNHGIIDCLSIHLSSPSTYYYYSTSTSPVYEYINASGERLYLGLNKYSEIIVHPNQYSNTYVKYNFSRIVGYLNMETNYYLDVEKRVIDVETKWTENKREMSDATLNNGEAYRCAKRGYIAFSTDYYYNYSYSSNGVYLDSVDTSLERHSYILLGNDTLVSYTPKI